MKRFLVTHLKKNPFCLRKSFISLLLIPTFLMTNLFAAETIEVDDNYEEANFKTIKLLNRLTENRVVKQGKTAGFDYRYTSKWYTPFTYDVYVGRYKQDSPNAIIRVEADKRGEEKAYKAILQQEFRKKEQQETEQAEEKKLLALQEKSHFLGQGINLLSPPASIIYSSYKSPVYNTFDTYSRFTVYLALDLLVAGITAAYINNTTRGKSFEEDLILKRGPTRAMIQNRTAGFFFGSLLVLRLYHTLDVYQGIGSHNRFSQLSYTFRF
ncbi:MAG: hypothetical protein AAF518_15475 [Spirochaetota bacterium]